MAKIKKHFIKETQKLIIVISFINFQSFIIVYNKGLFLYCIVQEK